MEIVHRQIRVNLKNYPYMKDIENRLLLAQLSVFEVDLLREIINDSLKIPLTNLASTLEIDSSSLIEALDKLSTTKLFKREGPHLLVDKERRKYYESLIEKFEQDFVPDLDFLQGLLNKVPIHVLPLWYDILGHSDNIFASIVEKYLITPKIYRQHLANLSFDQPVIHDIIRDLYQAPNFTLPSAVLIDKYKLTREQFEEYILLLEYHFVCCLSYARIEKEWQEVITPFAEWLEYLRFEAATKPKPIKDISKIKQINPVIDFGFIRDIQTVLRDSQTQSTKIYDWQQRLDQTAEYLDQLLFKLTQLKLIQIEGGSIRTTEKGLICLNMPLAELSAFLSTHPLNYLRQISDPSLQTLRYFRQIEKSLTSLTVKEWVYLDDFLLSFTSALGDKESIVLKIKGKKWKYVIPTYSEEEKDLIKASIAERLFELGIVAVGMYQGKICFCLTPFGRSQLN